MHGFVKRRPEEVDLTCFTLVGNPVRLSLLAQIWGRGVDLERFSPARRSMAFRRRLGARDGDILVIWVGRLVPEKRPDIWRDVLKKLKDEGHRVRGVVVGVGPCQTMFDDIPYVSVMGWLSGLDLAEAYASCDLLLFPSDVETFGNVTLEALGSGIPAGEQRKDTEVAGHTRSRRE